MNLNKHFKRNKNSIKFNFKIIVIGESQEDNFVPKLIGERFFLQELNYIAEKFFTRYPKHIFDNWDYDVSKFIGFNEVLAEHMINKF